MYEEGIAQKIEELMQTIGLDCTKCSDRCSSGCRGDPGTGYAPFIPLDELSEASIRQENPEIIDEYLSVPVMKSDEDKGCHAFNQETGECSIHEIKPLYCRIYPFRIGAYSTIPSYGSSYFAGLGTELQRCEMVDPDKIDRKERSRLEIEASRIMKNYPIFSARMEKLFRKNPELFERYRIK